MEIKVSVIIPVYNTEIYLKKCINSVIDQTLKEIEIILIDDGSKDKSLDILKEFFQKDCRIRLITQKNSGQAVARNRGIKESKGKYIYFCDSDDLMVSNILLEECYNRAENEELDLVWFDGGIIEKDESKKNPYIKKDLNIGINSGREYLKQTLKSKVFSCVPWLFFIKKELLIKNKLKFPEGYFYEDEIFALKLLNSANYVDYIPKIFYKRTENPNSTTRNKEYHIKRTESLLKLVERTYFFLEVNEQIEIELKKLIIERINLYYRNLLNSLTFIKKTEKVFYIEQIKKADFYKKRIKFVERILTNMDSFYKIYLTLKKIKGN